MNQLTVVAAALKSDGSGLVITLPRPNRHHNIIHAYYKERDGVRFKGEQGFILSDGSFASRKRAAEVALAAGQVTKLTTPPYLFSEDVW